LDKDKQFSKITCVVEYVVTIGFRGSQTSREQPCQVCVEYVKKSKIDFPPVLNVSFLFLCVNYFRVYFSYYCKRQRFQQQEVKNDTSEGEFDHPFCACCFSFKSNT